MRILHLFDDFWVLTGAACCIYCCLRFGRRHRTTTQVYRIMFGVLTLTSALEGDIVEVVISAFYFMLSFWWGNDDDNDDHEDHDGGEPAGVDPKERARRLIEGLKERLPSPIPLPQPV